MSNETPSATIKMFGSEDDERYFVYFDGKYQGTDDQLFVEDFLSYANGKILRFSQEEVPEEWNYSPPRTLEPIDPLMGSDLPPKRPGNVAIREPINP